MSCVARELLEDGADSLSIEQFFRSVATATTMMAVGLVNGSVRAGWLDQPRVSESYASALKVSAEWTT